MIAPLPLYGYDGMEIAMKNRKKFSRKSAAALALSLLIVGAAPATAQANVLDDAKETILGLWKKATDFLQEYGVTDTVKQGYDTVTDFLFTYETQPDDEDMESLARSWAVTTWLADEEKEESNIYYFDNHTLTMVEDPTQIGRGYNLSKSPAGSSVGGKHTGILKAVVADAATYTVEWVNYDDELNQYLLRKMQEKNAPETEA